MTIADHIQYWLDTATQDWDTVETLRATNPRITLVFAHWTLEKLSKAHWVREHAGAMPPASDNVADLLAATSVVLTPAQIALVGLVKAFHDDVVESDPMRPLSQLKASETPQILLAQADELRQLLLKPLCKKA